MDVGGIRFLDGLMNTAALPMDRAHFQPWTGAAMREMPARIPRFSYAAVCSAFLIGLGSRLEYQIIGYMPFTEIALLLLTPFLLPKITARAVLQRTRWLLPLAMLWLASQLATDIFRETQWSLAARGAARIVILLIAMPFFVFFMRKNAYEKLIGFYAGAAISAAASGYVFKSGARAGRELVLGSAELTWETHWGAVLLLAAALGALLLYKRAHLLGYLFCAAVGVIEALNGSRSMAGMLLLGPGLCMALNFANVPDAAKRAVNRGQLKRMLLVAAAGLACALGVLAAYSWAASSHLLGDRAYAKYMTQSQSKYGILAGGRGDLLSAALAIFDSPIIGHGSWPRDRNNYYGRACEMLNVKLPTDFYKSSFPLIPSHSHIMQAWMEAGLMGGLFWMYVILVIGLGIATPFQDSKRLSLWACIVATSMVWNICFSPISARLDIALILAVYLNQIFPWPVAMPARSLARPQFPQHGAMPTA
jgi:hypothetical protein